MKLCQQLFIAKVIMLMACCILWAGVGIEVTPGAWDIGKGGKGEWVSSQITVKNVGTDMGKVVICGADSSDFSIGSIPALNQYVIEFSMDGETWTEVLKSSVTIISCLNPLESGSFYFRFQSPTTVNPETLKKKQDIPLKLLILPTIQIQDIWEIRTVDSGSQTYIPSLKMDKNGNPCLSYVDKTSKDLKYAKWNGSGWDIEIVDGNAGERSSLQFDASGNPAIGYSSNGTLKYAKWNGSGWETQVVDPGPYVGTYLDLDLNINGSICIAYSKADSIGNIVGVKYAYNDGSQWLLEDIATSGGYYVQLECDINSSPHVIYPDQQIIKYARRINSAWSITTIPDSNGGTFCSLKLGSNNNPFVSFWVSGPNDLKYAAFDGSVWNTVTVDSVGDMGWYSSLALDSNNNPHISYLDNTQYDLKYAHWDGDQWQFKTIDTGPTYTGYYTSISLNNDDLPRIAYLDYSTSSLKIAIYK